MAEGNIHYDNDSSNAPFTEFVIDGSGDITSVESQSIGSGGTSKVYPCSVSEDLLGKVNKMLGTNYSNTTDDIKSNNFYSDGNNYVMKKYKVHENFDDDDLKCFLREVTIMAKAIHPYVIKMIGWNIFNKFISPKKASSRSGNVFAPYIVTPRYKCNLEEFIKSGKFNDLTPTKKSEFMYALLRGYRYLHVDLNIIIRDIKMKNVFVDNEDMPIIADFGFSKELNDRNLVCNSKVYRSGESFEPPEVTGLSECEVTKKTDIFSLGIVLFHMTFNPNNEYRKMDQTDKIRDYLGKNLHENDAIINYASIGDSLGSPTTSGRRLSTFSPNGEEEDQSSIQAPTASYKTLNSTILKMLSEKQEDRPTITDICNEFWRNRGTFTYKDTNIREFEIFKENIDEQEKLNNITIQKSAICRTAPQNRSEKAEVFAVFEKHQNNKYLQLRKLLQMVDKEHYFNKFNNSYEFDDQQNGGNDESIGNSAGNSIGNSISNGDNNNERKKKINSKAALFLSLYYMVGYLVPKDLVLSYHFFLMCKEEFVGDDPFYITMEKIICEMHSPKDSNNLDISYNYEISNVGVLCDDFLTEKMGVDNTEKMFKKMFMAASILEATKEYADAVNCYIQVINLRNTVFAAMKMMKDEFFGKTDTKNGNNEDNNNNEDSKNAKKLATEQYNKCKNRFREIKEIAQKYYYQSMGRTGAILVRCKSPRSCETQGGQLLKIASEKSDDIYSKVQYGQYLIQQKKYEHALPIFESLAKDGPGKLCHPDAAYTIGELYFELGKREKALVYFKLAYEVFGQEEAVKYIDAIEKKGVGSKPDSNDF